MSILGTHAAGREIDILRVIERLGKYDIYKDRQIDLTASVIGENMIDSEGYLTCIRDLKSYGLITTQSHSTSGFFGCDYTTYHLTDEGKAFLQ